MSVIFNKIGIAWLVAVMLLLLIIDITPDSEPETKIFCAYGRVFIEFNSNGSTWGTLMLDDRGVPIPCSSEERLDTKSNII